MSLALLGRHMVLHRPESLQAAKQWHTAAFWKNGFFGESPRCLGPDALTGAIFIAFFDQ
jgi:hypothetical protein